MRRSAGTWARECSVAGAEKLTAWLAEHVACKERRPEQVRVELLARLLGEAEDPAAAAEVCEQLEQLLVDCVRVLGTDHPDTLTTRKYLAHLRGEAGDAAGAVTGYKELVPDVVHALGRHHPRTRAARNNLAHWRREAKSEVPRVFRQGIWPFNS